MGKGLPYSLKNLYKRVDALEFVGVTGVTVSPTTKSLVIDETQQIDVTVEPSNATNKSVSFSTSDATKATVSNTGVITAVAVGAATITATTDDGAKTATVSVTVTSE